MPWQIAFPNQPLGGAVNHVVEHREIVVADRFTVEANPLIDPKDRKSTRLNSSHGYISYAVFCLKKKTHGLQAARGIRGAVVATAHSGHGLGVEFLAHVFNQHFSSSKNLDGG